MLSKEFNHSTERKNLKRSTVVTRERKIIRGNSKKNSTRYIPRSPKKSINLKFNEKIKDINNKKNQEIEKNNNRQDEKFNKDREKQLEIVNKKYIKEYISKEQSYENIIIEIDLEKNLIYKGSIMSFNLLILKIKCLMKLLKEKIEIDLNSKIQGNYFEIDHYIQKVENEFIKLYPILNEDNKYEYEILTQHYCKFLFLMSIVCTKKEEPLLSLNYVSLAVNMLKVYFIRQRIASDIETYRIYARLVIMLINKLLSDNNISKSLLYISVLTRICQVALNIIYKNKLDKKYEYKFNKYLGYNFLFMGYCYELNTKYPNNYQASANAYKESFYFINKSNIHSIFSTSKVNIEKKCLYLSQLLKEKLQEKLIIEAMEKQRKYELEEMIKRQLIEEAKTQEKKYRLKLISSGFVPDNTNTTKVKNKLFNDILSPSNQKLMDKLDNDLISYVFKDSKIKSNNERFNNKKNHKNYGKLVKKLPSTEAMKNLCHYKMYDYLMTNEFKEFIINNDRLEFYNPKQQKKSLEKIQQFLNRKIVMNFKSENVSKDIDKDKEKDNPIEAKADANISTQSNIRNNILNLNLNNKEKIYKLLENTKDSFEETNISNINETKNYSPSIKRPLSTKTKNRSFIISKDKERNGDKEKKIIYNHKKLNKRCITYSDYSSSAFLLRANTNSHKNLYKDKKYKSKSMLASGKDDLENKKFDKSIFSNKYFNQFIYFENLMNKELKFQKQLLNLKNNNSKMFFKEYDSELQNNGIISTDDIYKSFLILNDKVTYKDRNFKNEIKNQKMKFRNKRMVANVFKSVSNKTKEGKEIKNVMRKVLDRYITEHRRNTLKRNKNKIHVDDINKLNEFSIMKLNDHIEDINNLLISKSKEKKLK